MTKEQFLLLKISEECAEIAQVCSKQIQFGKDNRRHDEGPTNSERLKSEITDLLAVANLLHDEGGIDTLSIDELHAAIQAKKHKMQKYLDVSVKLGRLPEIKL